MHFALTEEQQSLKEAARGFLAELPTPFTMAEQTDAYDGAAWARLVEEQGWPLVIAPEEVGGWGFGHMELAVLFEEAGRALVPCPLFATVALGVEALLVNGSPAQQETHLEAIAGGVTATLGWHGEVTATGHGDDWHLNGALHRVVDGDSAGLLIVACADGLFVVRGDAVDRHRVPGLDTTRPIATVVLRDTPAERLEGHDLDTVLTRASVLLAAEQVGAADACLDLATEYAKVRKQFGQPIGRFQALQHKLADMCVEVEHARAATWYAATALDHGLPDAALAAHTAAALAGDAFLRCAGDSIQVHGGIGFTWEHAAHLYFKRARASAQLVRSPRDARRAVADALLGGA